MTVSKTSVAWAYWANLRQALSDAEWPGEKPQVVLGDLASREINVRELVAVSRMSTEQQWATFGQLARDEVCRFNQRQLTHSALFWLRVASNSVLAGGQSMLIKYIGPCADRMILERGEWSAITDENGEVDVPEDLAKGYLEQDIWVAVKGASKAAKAEKE